MCIRDRIAHLLVDDLRQRLIANGMNIKLTDAAYDKICLLYTSRWRHTR